MLKEETQSLCHAVQRQEQYTEREQQRGGECCRAGRSTLQAENKAEHDERGSILFVSSGAYLRVINIPRKLLNKANL